jgi:uncharacterized membrane protein
MKSLLDDPKSCAYAGLGLSAVLLVAWILIGGVDRLSLVAFVIRVTHILAAMVWVGLVFFVNFVQLIAMRDADDAAKSFMFKTVIPNVFWWVRHASTVTVASGLLMLIAAGYLLPSILYGSGVYVAPARAMLLWLGVIAALAMWMFVNMYIWPALRIVLGINPGINPGDAAAKATAHATVKTYARLNLILALPVTVAMVAAAHLY